MTPQNRERVKEAATKIEHCDRILRLVEEAQGEQTGSAYRDFPDRVGQVVRYLSREEATDILNIIAARMKSDLQNLDLHIVRVPE